MIYVVTCLFDRKVRHQAPFGSVAEAVAWAEHGHVCTAEHGIEEFPDAPSSDPVLIVEEEGATNGR